MNVFLHIYYRLSGVLNSWEELLHFSVCGSRHIYSLESSTHGYIYIYIHAHLFLLEGFHWNLNDSKSPLSRIIIIILGDFNIAVVWIVLILFLISSFPRYSSRFLVSVPSAPTTIGIIVAVMLHSLPHRLTRIKYFYLFVFFSFYSFLFWNSKIHEMKSSFFLLINTVCSFLHLNVPFPVITKVEIISVS